MKRWRTACWIVIALCATSLLAAGPLSAQAAVDATGCWTHTVRGGETLYGIAITYGTTPLKIVLDNDLDEPAALPTSVRICQPGAGPSASGGQTLVIGGAPQVNLRWSPGFLWKLATDVARVLSYGDRVVTTGAPVWRDSLWWWPVEHWGLRGWVAEWSSSGQRLLVPLGTGGAEEPRNGVIDATVAEQFYVVTYGDTLAAIAQRLGSTVTAIVRRNGLTTSLLHPGDGLSVPLDRVASSAGWVAGEVTWVSDGRPYGRSGVIVSVQRLGGTTRHAIAVAAAVPVEWSVGGRASLSDIRIGTEIEAVGTRDATGLVSAEEVFILPVNPVTYWSPWQYQ